MENSQEAIRKHLSNFWKFLSGDLQKKIGQEVAFAIAILGTSESIMDITRKKIHTLGISSPDFYKAMNLFEGLGENEKRDVTKQLSDYFLSRNK